MKNTFNIIGLVSILISIVYTLTMVVTMVLGLITDKISTNVLTIGSMFALAITAITALIYTKNMFKTITNR